MLSRHEMISLARWLSCPLRHVHAPRPSGRRGACRARLTTRRLIGCNQHPRSGLSLLPRVCYRVLDACDPHQSASRAPLSSFCRPPCSPAVCWRWPLVVSLRSRAPSLRGPPPAQLVISLSSRLLPTQEGCTGGGRRLLRPFSHACVRACIWVHVRSLGLRPLTRVRLAPASGAPRSPAPSTGRGVQGRRSRPWHLLAWSGPSADGTATA